MAATAPKQAFDKLTFIVRTRDEFLDPAFCEKAAQLIATDGKASASEQLGVNVAVASLAALVHEHGLIGFRTEKELLTKLVKARDADAQGWAVIGARLGGLTEGRVQALYEQATGTPAYESQLVRKGRPRGDGRGWQPKPVAKPVAKKATKQAAPKRTAKKATEVQKAAE